MLRKRALRGVEQLEDKLLLTGCDVDFDGETLDVKCGDDRNVINVSEVKGDLIVNVGDGNKNLGSAKNLKDVEIKSGGGADVMSIRDLVIMDSIELKSEDTGGLTKIDHVTIGGDLKIKRGGGLDVFSVFVGGTADVKTGDGDDRFFGFDFRVKGDLEIKTMEGKDTVELHKTVAATIEVKSEDGDDRVVIANSTVLNDLKMKTGEGRDIVELNNVKVDNTIDIRLGEGDDILFAKRVTAGNDIKIDGGPEKDSLFGEKELDAANATEIKGFETIF